MRRRRAAAAIGAECAARQGKFWAFHDLLFRVRRGGDVGTFLPARLLAHGRELGLDQEAFRACLQDGQVQEKIRKDIRKGMERSVKGTPSFIIDGRLITVNQRYMVFREAIEEALNRAK